MSLDVYILYKTPKPGNNGSVCCGSTVPIGGFGDEKDSWTANVTHNMTEMAKHIPVYYRFNKPECGINDEEYESDLHLLVWRPEEVGLGCNDTDTVAQALQSGISYMVAHRDELLQYNPSNGWGSYDSFLLWLIEYWKACLNNPGCKIEVSR